MAMEPSLSFEQVAAWLEDDESQLMSSEGCASVCLSQSKSVESDIESSPRSQLAKPPRSGRKFKGVRRRRWGKVVCEIRGAQGKRIWLGSYETDEAAARAFDAAARILQGERAWLNFPHDTAPPTQLPGSIVKVLEEHRVMMEQQRLKKTECKRSPKKQALPQLEAASAKLEQESEWECILDEMQDASPSIWMQGVGYISPARAEDASPTMTSDYEQSTIEEEQCSAPSLDLSCVSALQENLAQLIQANLQALASCASAADCDLATLLASCQN